MNQNKYIKSKPMLLVTTLFLGSTIVGSLTSNNAVVYASTVKDVPIEKQLYIQDTIALDYGDTLAANKIIQEVHNTGMYTVSESNRILSNETEEIYLVDNFQITITGKNIHSVGEGDIIVSIQEVGNADLNVSNLKHLSIENKNSISQPAKGLSYTYNLHIAISDNLAPVIELSEERVELEEGESFDPEEYIVSIYDEVDGDINDYDIENDVDVDVPGEYEVFYRAVDVNGNKSEASIIVIVNEKEEPEPEVEEVAPVNASSPANNTSPATDAPAYSGANAIVNSAYNQLGRNQDCTRLVSNALAAVGIYHHSYPAGYLKLGTVVSYADAQPGDVIYYLNGGAGVPHVAIYIGNGQAIHGGWKGYTTVIASAFIGPNPVFIRVR